MVDKSQPFLGLLLGRAVVDDLSRSSPPLELVLFAPTSPYLPFLLSPLLERAEVLRPSMLVAVRDHSAREAAWMTCRPMQHR